MDNIEKIARICSADIRPSTKVALIILLIEGTPLTTADLNNNLCLNKTLDNYKDLFEESIAAGYVKMTSMKTRAGITRVHFELDVDSLMKFLD